MFIFSCIICISFGYILVPGVPKIMSAATTKGGALNSVLAFKEDYYNGVIIDETSLPSNPQDFEDLLVKSIAEWQTAQRRGVWLKIPRDFSAYIPIAIKHSFDFHHAESGYCMLTRWLPGTESSLPPNASHQVGVGAFVLDKEGKVLVVREKHGPLGGTNVFKLPTGLLTAGEEIGVAAEREVLEETGLQVSFEAVLGFSHNHKYAFGKSDLFFITKLRLMDEHPERLIPQASEIEEVRWMDLEQYFAQPIWVESPLHSEIHRILKQHAMHVGTDSLPQLQASPLRGVGTRVSVLYHCS